MRQTPSPTTSWQFVAVSLLLLASATTAQVTERVSLSLAGAQLIGGGDLPTPSSCVVTDDGRFVAFISGSRDVVPGDTNGTWDVFVRDRQMELTERVSVDSHGGQSNGFSALYGLTISPDGRYVAFESRASNLVPGDTNGASDIFIRDRLSRTTERISVATGGTQGNAQSWYPEITPDSRYVAFVSGASNLVPGDTNGVLDFFVRDRVSRTTERVSVATGGAQANDYSYKGGISADGRFVTFYSAASNLVPGDTNARLDVFVHDRSSGTTERVSVSTGGGQGDGHSSMPSISADGRYVAFISEAANLVPGDVNGFSDVFVRDRQNGTTELVSVGVGGVQGNGSCYETSISADGRYVSFDSGANNLVPGDQPGIHIFVRDRVNGTTERVSVPTTGSLTPQDASAAPSVSPGGRYVVFRSQSTNLVSGDTNGQTDVFLHDRNATGFMGLCGPGTGGVIACPCGNPPGGPNQGCNNSSSTGGASLSASGIAYLQIDSLVFTTTGEKPTSTSILLQGTGAHANGIVYGQGVRCVGGTLKRLFTKTAVAGSITAPDFGAGDATVSARSVALGDVIQPGQSRWYLVYYRDPVVLGGCPASSTFNATQTGQVTWWP
jgi:Tol biopolymer transport system component